MGDLYCIRGVDFVKSNHLSNFKSEQMIPHHVNKQTEVVNK